MQKSSSVTDAVVIVSVCYREVVLVVRPCECQENMNITVKECDAMPRDMYASLENSENHAANLPILLSTPLLADERPSMSS